jgi:hypothetical protein
MVIHDLATSAPEESGWHYARRREATSAPIEIVHVVRGAAGEFEVDIPGAGLRLTLAAFEWLGPVIIPSLVVRTDSPAVATSYTAPIERHLMELLSAIRAKGYRNASVGIVLSASGDGVIVGTYLNPDSGQAISMLDIAFTDGTLHWAQQQVQRLPEASPHICVSPSADAPVCGVAGAE